MAHAGRRLDASLSYAALRFVLHALRDRLTVQESAHFAAQLTELRQVVDAGDRLPIAPAIEATTSSGDSASILAVTFTTNQP